MAKTDLTVARLRELHDYDPATGVFTRLKTRGGYMAGTLSGSLNTLGYRVLSIDKHDYYCHRLAFLFATGGMPDIVDHINGDKSDNRMSNLRPSSKRLNAQNIKKANAANKLGILGVSNGQRGRYAANIQTDGKNRFLGEFETPRLAHDAYLQAKRVLHTANTL